MNKKENLKQEVLHSGIKFVASKDLVPPVGYAMFSTRNLSESAKNRLRQMAQENQEKDDHDNEPHDPTV